MIEYRENYINNCYVPMYPMPWTPPQPIPQYNLYTYPDITPMLRRIERLEKEVRRLRKAHYARRQKEITQ